MDANEKMMKWFSIDNQDNNTVQSKTVLDEFKSNNSIYAYVVSTAGDDYVCDACKKHGGEKYETKYAVMHVNFPPFCDNCRCVALPCYKHIQMPWD